MVKELVVSAVSSFNSLIEVRLGAKCTTVVRVVPATVGDQTPKQSRAADTDTDGEDF